MVEHPGNAARRTICTCEEGYHMVQFGFCLRNADCPPGTGVTEQGNGCKRCPRGFYSNQYSYRDSCRPWTNCTSHGLAVVEKGTRTRDVTCGPLNLTTIAWITNDGVADLGVADKSRDANPVKIQEMIVIGLLGFLITYSVTMSAFAFCTWRKCRKGQLQDRMEIQVEDSELDYDMHYGVQESLRCAGVGSPSLISHSVCSSQHLERQCQPIPDTWDPGIDPYVEDVVEYSTLPKTQPKRTTANWLSQVSLPSAQNVSANLTKSTKLKSKSSEEYMREMQMHIADGYAKVLSADAAEHLAATLGPSWRQVAKRLGVEQHQIDHIWNENRQDFERQTFKMLSCWQRNKTGTATISELYDALLACNEDKLCNQLKAMENDPSKSLETKVYCA
ncbi:uncharacterized protein LOC118406894 [Branchiostoma floridae]|uniref:Uncharacterized protein LOC118406894 n=1 Tax=Branchiostoma floridae TaxID=7739 RepID=A0A9J7HTK9_BRAFL|nr:uncharacterized protein LOC118406894 [Branchiostoma floridae]